MLLKTMLGTILDYYIAWYNQDFWVTRKQPKNGFQVKLEFHCTLGCSIQPYRVAFSCFKENAIPKKIQWSENLKIGATNNPHFSKKNSSPSSTIVEVPSGLIH